MSRRDLTGQRFGRLVVIERAPDHIQPSGYRETMWRCQCDCGDNNVIVRTKCLLQGVTKSCGCYMRDKLSERAGKHYKNGTRLYAIWDSMRQRCNNPHNKQYHNYGERGIKICSEWDDYQNFYDWAISTGYDESALRGKYTLDRIDVNKNYCPENCRWADTKVQSVNKRNTVRLTYNNETHPLTEWSDIVGIAYQTLWRRYSKGWSTEKILTKPV